jgi:tight adherence protein B
MFLRVPRRLTAAAALVGGLLLVAPPAQAAEPSASIAGIEVKSDNLVGLITSTTGSGSIDSSLTVSLGGKDYPVDAITSGTGTPVTRSAMLVVDTSGSMGEAGMRTVRAAVAAFLKSVPDDVRVGLVSFAGSARLELAPTTDQGRVQSAVNSLESDGETALYDGLDLGVRALGSKGERSILLLSDGADTASSKASQASVTAAIKAQRVRTEAVAFKTSEGDQSALKAFAAAGGGSVVSAANSGAVQSAFTSAAKTLASQLTFSLPLPPGVSGAQNVKVSGTADGKRFAATALVDLGAGVTAKATTAAPAGDVPIVGPIDETVEAGAGSRLPVIGVSPLLAIALGTVFLGVLVGGIAFASGQLKSGRQTRVENIERYVSQDTSAGRTKIKRSAAVSENLVFLGEKMMENRDSTSKTLGLIEKADLPLRAGEWWVLRIVSLVAGLAVAFILFNGGLGMTIFAVVLGLLLGFFAPSIVLRFLASRRAKKFESQLPDVLTLVASSLSTGFSLPQALDAVAKDSPEPSAKEFSRALAETRIGADVADALDHMSDRMDSDNMRWTAMAIRIQREVGGNLAETLKTTAKTLREREELRRHVKALSAEGKLSAYILVALPIGIFLYTMKTNREYIELLWTKPLGLVMLATGCVFIGVGIFWMRKTVEVEV